MGKCRIPLSFVLLSAIALAVPSCTVKSRNEPPNTVHLVEVAKIKGLDPIAAEDDYSNNEIGRAYEGLLQYHYLKRPYVLIPNLAESMPQISGDGLVLTFHLKKGVLFQDDPCFKATGGKGRELTADDFVYSWKRLADPKNAAANWWLFDGKIAGLNAWHDEAAKTGSSDYSKSIAGLRALDRYTLQVTLVRRSAQLLFALAMPGTAAVPREAVDYYGAEFQNHAVGTGPFRLVEYNPNSKVVWDRNPTYRHEVYPSDGSKADRDAGLLDDAGKALPLADRVSVLIFEEQQPMWLNFLQGRVDVSSIPKDNYASAITPGKELMPELKEKGIRLQKAPNVEVVHLAFNMADPLIGKNKMLRQALSLAYPSDSFIQLFYSGQGLAAEGPIPPGLDGYDPSYRNTYRQFNLAKAKELLAKAGYPNGQGLPPLEYLTLSDSTSRQISEFDQKVFGALGVRLNVSAFSWPEFMKAMKERRGQVYGQSWLADYPDAEDFLQLFYSKNMAPGPNDSNYSNPEFDKLYEQALTLVPGAKRTALYKKMAAMINEDCPWIEIAQRLGFRLTQRWLRNYQWHDFEHSVAKYYRVDPALKAK